ncbi:MAG: hypothetical protein NVS3B15_04350 [Sediminibacterium sp.]
MRKLLLILFIFFSVNGFSQLSDAFKELKAFVRQQPPMTVDTTPYLSIYHKNELHYLYPFYKAFLQEPQLIRSQSTSGFYDDLSQAAAFAGDYNSVPELEKASYETLTDSVKQQISKQTDTAKEATYTDARRYILNKARSSRVIMINEAHDKPLHQVFIASLLEELYQQGYHYVALESLNPHKNAMLTKLNMFTGHYTCEPAAGELVRKALELGFTLVSFEDTIYRHTPNQREYKQAENIYAVLKKDPGARIIVQAGYGHMEKGAQTDSAIPMAAYFKIIAGMDPLTIDQVEMTERSNSAYGALVYESWMKKHPASDAVVPLVDDRPIDPFGMNLYDICVIHPPTTYSNGRPVWLAMNGWKKETAVPPAYRSLFMVQAYYDKEYNEKTAGQLVPADQTYNTATNGYYYLYLRKGKYKIVFRDKLYRILGTRTVIV